MFCFCGRGSALHLRGVAKGCINQVCAARAVRLEMMFRTTNRRRTSKQRPQQSCQNQLHGIPQTRFQATAGDAERPHPCRLNKKNSDACSQTYVVVTSVGLKKLWFTEKIKNNQLKIVLFFCEVAIDSRKPTPMTSSGELTPQN